MKYAILYNIFVCWMVAGMGLLTARAILARQDEPPATKAFGFFWLFSAGLWLCSGLRHLFFFFQHRDLDVILFYFVQLFLAFHVMAAGAFLTFSFFGNKRMTRGILALLGLLTAAFLFFFFKDGIQQTKTTPWATEHLISGLSFGFFLPVYGYCILMTLVALVRDLTTALIRGASNRRNLFALLALFLYEAAGVFDVQGQVADHRLLIIRGVYMASALISYLTFAWDSSSIQIVRASKEPPS